MEKLFSLSLLISFLLQCLSVVHSWKNLVLLDLGSNLLDGPLPSSLCNLGSLNYLLLSDNKLSGKIPDCFGNMSTQLTVLDLRKNGFDGKIPDNFPENNTLRNLGLNGNHLEGTLPQSLLNCQNLEVLDVGHNNISDNFPVWLGTLPKLNVLVLTWNRFHGTINISSNSSFQQLRILDISYNQFEGHISAGMIDTFQSMKKNNNQSNDTQPKYMGDNSYYQDSVTLTFKGLEMVVERIFTVFTTIDLSGNRFEGSIPKSVGELNALKVLNLSRNHFDGEIPSSIGNLSALESLDLSWNQLIGKIPAELVKLNYLEFLNLSQNRLVGQIPSGGQLYTFDRNCYEGNPELCGSPLDACGNPSDGSHPGNHQTDHQDFMSGLTLESVLLGFGCGLVLGFFTGFSMLYTQKPQWLNAIVQDMLIESIRRRRIRNRRSIRWGL